MRNSIKLLRTITGLACLWVLPSPHKSLNWFALVTIMDLGFCLRS